MQPDARYNNTDDAIMRLDQSIVRYKGLPFYCRIQNGIAYLYDLASAKAVEQGDAKETFRISFNDEELDIRSVTIGYINGEGGALYITRPPFRKQKQGTSTVNCYIAGVGTMAFKQISHAQLFSHEVKLALLGKYPLMKNAQKSLIGSDSSGVTSQAFSNEFALKKVGKEILVYFEQQLIGFTTKINGIEIYPHCQDSVLTMKLTHMGIEVS